MRCEAELLRHQTETQPLRLLRPAHAPGLTVDCDRAAVRLDDAHENIDERALARAILAAKSANFSGADGQRDILERGGPWIGLAHAPDRQDLLQNYPPPRRETPRSGLDRAQRSYRSLLIDHACEAEFFPFMRRATMRCRTIGRRCKLRARPARERRSF